MNGDDITSTVFATVAICSWLTVRSLKRKIDEQAAMLAKLSNEILDEMKRNAPRKS
ncbi:hypothetical protein ACFSTI_29340 [Rhizorhabdus histidinilytica]|uniref:Uncharacterized protein n=1 Tax=Rhizorhabdus histidinilytica TaxID=439228 RepID=A0A1T5CH42_9SPHN|nr:hypothetical protein [Rhizorhabdus histidinilytica]SKB58769.1 hypothetical protein SAMN06295920_10460 [Rhizorhabdus histidinilytica]